ncbi:hypothetical protein [Nocardia asiatica]|uniref:hypothetical protein n=1 Tax=Nocardia asiatica TaxID=209252 RepID=UPI0024573297|nr:hypothetical protein [Nocardia asiatica]
MSTTLYARTDADTRRRVLEVFEDPDLTARAEDRSLVLHIEDGEFFRGTRCEECGRAAATAVEWSDRKDGRTDESRCGDHLADLFGVLSNLDSVDHTEHIDLRVSPWYLAYVHNVAA